jgi:hypothetical protein
MIDLERIKAFGAWQYWRLAEANPNGDVEEAGGRCMAARWAWYAVRPALNIRA